MVEELADSTAEAALVSPSLFAHMPAEGDGERAGAVSTRLARQPSTCSIVN